MAAGGTFGLLLTESGKVYTCGYGALGLGPEKTQILLPEQITALSGIRKIVASTDYAAAINGMWSCSALEALQSGPDVNLFFLCSFALF